MRREGEPLPTSTVEQLQIRLQLRYLIREVTLSNGKRVALVDSPNFDKKCGDVLEEGLTPHVVSTRPQALSIEVPSGDKSLGIWYVPVRSILSAGANIVPNTQKDDLVLIRLFEPGDESHLAIRQVLSSSLEDFDAVDLETFEMFNPLAEHPELETINALQVLGTVVGIHGENLDLG